MDQYNAHTHTHTYYNVFPPSAVRSMCQVLENRSQQDEQRMDQLTNQLKEARMLAEDADTKSDEVSRKLAFVEDELEVAEDRVRSGEAKIMELEEELKVRKATEGQPLYKAVR